MLGDLAADVMRRLRRGIERELVGARGGERDRAARLQRHARDPLIDEIDRDDMRGPGKGRFDLRLVAAAEAEADIARRRFMQARRILVLRAGAFGDRRQGLVVDLDPFGRVHRLRQRVGDDEGDRLADMAHDVARQRIARRLRHRRAVGRRDRPHRLHRRDVVGRHVGAGIDRGDTRRLRCGGGVDLQNLAHAHAASARTRHATRRQNECRRRSGRCRSGNVHPLPPDRRADAWLGGLADSMLPLPCG